MKPLILNLITLSISIVLGCGTREYDKPPAPRGSEETEERAMTKGKTSKTEEPTRSETGGGSAPTVPLKTGGEIRVDPIPIERTRDQLNEMSEDAHNAFIPDSPGGYQYKVILLSAIAGIFTAVAPFIAPYGRNADGTITLNGRIGQVARRSVVGGICGALLGTLGHFTIPPYDPANPLTRFTPDRVEYVTQSEMRYWTSKPDTETEPSEEKKSQR